jgi:hypothetical protein
MNEHKCLHCKQSVMCRPGHYRLDKHIVMCKSCCLIYKQAISKAGNQLWISSIDDTNLEHGYTGWDNWNEERVREAISSRCHQCGDVH